MSEKQKFWTKFACFITFALIVPITYMSIRFELFQKVSKIQIGLWGIIVFAIMISVIVVLIKYYIAGLKTKYSWWKQVVEGIVKLILPLGLVLTIMVFLKDNIELVIESLAVIIPCEFVAILVNPLPKWAFENNVEGLAEISDKIFKREPPTKESE